MYFSIFVIHFLTQKMLLYCPSFFPKADNTNPLYCPRFYFIVRLLLYCPPFYFIVRLFTLLSSFLLYRSTFYSIQSKYLKKISLKISEFFKNIMSAIFTRCDEVASSLRMPRFIIRHRFFVDSRFLANFRF
jgi:predicted neutral ceramidase superfamily lipid hydrolase